MRRRTFFKLIPAIAAGFKAATMVKAASAPVVKEASGLTFAKLMKAKALFDSQQVKPTSLICSPKQFAELLSAANLPSKDYEFMAVNGMAGTKFAGMDWFESEQIPFPERGWFAMTADDGTVRFFDPNKPPLI